MMNFKKATVNNATESAVDKALATVKSDVTSSLKLGLGVAVGSLVFTGAAHVVDAVNAKIWR